MKAMPKGMRWRLRAGTLGCCGALWLCIPAAPAQAQQQQEGVSPQAQELFDEAVADYMARRWDLAALKFRKAYAYSPEALFLYNQAKALEKLENYQGAIDALIRARDQQERPLPPDIAAKVAPFLAELETSLAAQKAKEKEEEERMAEAAKAVVVPPPPAPEPQEAPEEGWSGLRWVGLGAVAAGGGLMIGGGVLAAGVKEEADRLNDETGQTPPQFRADLDAAQSDQTTARVVFFSGAGLALVGAGLVAWDLFSDDGERAGKPSVNLKVGPTSVGWEARW